MPAVTASSILRRPYFSASGPETRVKMPKNTTPAISIQRKSLRVKPRPGTKRPRRPSVIGLPAFSAAALAASRLAARVP